MLLVNLIFLLGIFFVVSMQPVFMIAVLIMMTFMYSLSIYENVGSYWFSYVLLMVMLSGVLVIFTYMASLIPNESFEMYGVVILFLLMISVMIKLDCGLYGDMSMLSVSLWSTYLGMFSLFLISFLLSIMLMVVILSCMNNSAICN